MLPWRIEDINGNINPRRTEKDIFRAESHPSRLAMNGRNQLSAKRSFFAFDKISSNFASNFGHGEYLGEICWNEKKITLRRTSYVVLQSTLCSHFFLLFFVSLHFSFMERKILKKSNKNTERDCIQIRFMDVVFNIFFLIIFNLLSFFSFIYKKYNIDIYLKKNL